MLDRDQQVLHAFQNAGKPLRPGDIVKLLNVGNKEISESIKRLQAQGKLYSPKRCFYAPKSE